MSAASPEPPKKRLRAARACISCRNKKYKCDESYPCSLCRRQNLDCVYEDAQNIHDRFRSAQYIAELEKKIELLSAQLESSQSLKKDSSAVTQTTDCSTQALHALPGDETTFVEDDSVGSEGVEDPPDEVRDVNPHTKSVEFHGNTSSMAFLAGVAQQSQRASERPITSGGIPLLPRNPTLVFALHNPAFSPDSNIPSPNEQEILGAEGYYFRQAQIFLDGYFENLHFVHPILNREVFFARSEDLWFRRPERQPKSFVALYYSVLSLGALVRVWDEPSLAGLNRFQWSRKLFDCARLALGEMRSTNDMETIQCLFFLAKVCQNELNPHLAYMYLGTAVRASLSAGHNRHPTATDAANTTSESDDMISKTWWGLYSLEMELSLSLGRPDSLGMDEYHNRTLPPAVGELEILGCMVPFARLMRQTSVFIYLTKSSIREKITMAQSIEQDMDHWMSGLSQQIRPHPLGEKKSSRILSDPKWARRQRLVLQLRYHNVKMVLFRPFLLYASQTHRRLPPLLESIVAKCVEAARCTIETMHEVFVFNVFFRSWWYNTTYILYAASIVLCYTAQAAPLVERPSLYRLTEMTVEILEAMAESVVARKASEMIRQALAQVRGQPVAHAQALPPSPEQEQLMPTFEPSMNAMLDMPLSSIGMDSMFNFDASFDMDESQILLWTDVNDVFRV